MSDDAWVFVIDDDPAVRRALVRLLRSTGLRAESFACAAEFLDYPRPDAPGCLVLDVQMPELGGLELQQSLRDGHVSLPIVFITGYGDIPMSVRAIKSGAVDFLPKPFDDETLLRAVRQALAQDARERRARSEVNDVRQRVDSLTPREREVLAHVVDGRLNKQIARRLKITEKTIKVHRGQVMRKMQAGSLAELVRLAERVGIQGPQQ
jgi:FixJ family two-component response regulator